MPVLKNWNTDGTSVSTPSAWLWFQNGIASPPETEWQLVAAGNVRKSRANVSDQPKAEYHPHNLNIIRLQIPQKL
jgi:hypothetical protein